MSNKQTDMFSSIPESSVSDNSLTSGYHHYFLTNRNNLLEILSSGQIKPASWYYKYYSDLGEVCPDVIPLLLHPPSQKLITETLGQEETSFPVLIELDLDHVSGRVDLISAGFSLRETELTGHKDGLAVVVPGMLPASLIKGIHFRSETELNEYQVRQFENVPEITAGYWISPSLFSGPDFDTEALFTILNRSAKRRSRKIPGAYQLSDSLGGILMLLGSLAEADIRMPLDTLAWAFNYLQKIVPDITTAGDRPVLPEAFSWLGVILDLFLKPLSALPVKTEHMGQLLSGMVSESSDPEEFLFVTILRQLASMTPSEYSYQMLLMDLEAEFNRSKSAWSESIAHSYLEFFSRIQDIFSGQASIDEYYQNFPVEEKPVSAALILFLIRNNPRSVLSWLNTTSRPDPSVLSRAVTFSGDLFGRTLLPLDCRPGIEYTRLVDFIIARCINQIYQGVTFETQYPLLVQSITRPDGTSGSSLRSGATVVLQQFARPAQVKREIPPSIQASPKKMEPPTRVPSREPSAARPTESGQAEVSARDQKDHLDEDKKPVPGRFSPPVENSSPMIALHELLLKADPKITSGPTHDATVELCRSAGWVEFFSTVIPLEGSDFILEYRSGKNEFRIHGIVHPEYRLIKPEEFRKRLATMPPASLEQFRTQALDKLMVDLGLLPRDTSFDNTVPPEPESGNK